MQTPPPFHGFEGQPAPQKRKTSAVVIIFAVLGVLLLCCGLPVGVIGFYGYKGFNGAMKMGGCVANVNFMKAALQEYSKQHDGKLPNAKTWQTDIGKYFESGKKTEGSPITIWKAGGEWSCEDNGVKTGFMFNEALSERKMSEVTKANPEAVAIFETKTVSFNQSGPLVKLPFSESPKFMGEFTDQRRGWMLIDAEASKVYTYDEKGKFTPFDMNFKSKKSKGGIDFTMDSGDSKADNSN